MHVHVLKWRKSAEPEVKMPEVDSEKIWHFKTYKLRVLKPGYVSQQKSHPV